MTQKTLLAIDQGTTSSRAIVFSEKGEALCTHQQELALVYPENGWVEQDALAIWADTLAAVRACLQDYPDVAAIGITNQRETTVVWDKATGTPVYNAIVWQDRRGAELCRKLKDFGHEDVISEKTGLLLDPYFSATKLAWLLDNVESARGRAERGDLLFGTIDTWLLWNLTGGAVHATDASNASRTMLFNVRTQQWDEELLELFAIPAAMLPKVCDNVADFGWTTDGLLPRRYHIGGMAGDQQAALIGQACFAPGMVKSTYGTGCFALMNIGETFRRSRNRLLTTVAYRLNGKSTFAIEGSIFVAGAAIQWLRDNMKFFADAAVSEALARSVNDTGGVYFIPAFTGLGAPYWNPEARGAILGLTRDTTIAHITRAALEAQVYQTLDLMDAMVKDGGTNPAVLRVDGGLVANSFMCQFLADMLGRRVEIPQSAETTALGAAFLAGLQVGIYQSLDDITAVWTMARSYQPEMKKSDMERLYAGWQAAISRIAD